ncbi:hypothetical protein DAPPUDRAFT_332530 [Daphnia pulex]|uniref:Chromo domain-containing protein n=1 Tax=Daphnia pulex TaxID=6669 RepID=E9HQ82_DAPPU|nr:hypothetical protein DAPPUDRAFT_332530 [Daphnia pulex]|eukprot:EFX66077.1 hypothetical protein DAPPUDRAFT_332530 [Daphnia pulex]
MPQFSSNSQNESVSGVFLSTLKKVQFFIERTAGFKGPKVFKRCIVKWIGYDYTDNTWEPSSNLYCKDLVNYFQKWLSGLQVQQLTDADVPHQRTGKPHTNTIIDIDTIDDDVVEVLPPDAVLLEAQLKWIHQEGKTAASLAAASIPPVRDEPRATGDGPNSDQVTTVAVIPAAATVERQLAVIPAAATVESLKAVIPAELKSAAPLVGFTNFKGFPVTGYVNRCPIHYFKTI